MTTNWYVLRSKPRKEDFVLDQLGMHGIEAYCPFLKVKPVNPRSRKIQAYLPGYVFVHTDLTETKMSFLHWMPGALGFVSFDQEPAIVPDGLIPAIRNTVENINEAVGVKKPIPFKQGDIVRVSSGPFAGFEAVFDTQISGSERVRVFLKLMQKRNQMPLELPASQIHEAKRVESRR